MSTALCWSMPPLRTHMSCLTYGNSDSSAIVTILHLPDEVISLIAAELSPGDLFRLAQTSRTIHRVMVAAFSAWAASLERAYCIPRALREQLRHPIPAGVTWRDVCLGLRLTQPAAQRSLGLQLSQGTSVPSTTSQFPKVLHMNGTAQRTLQVAFPQLPPGRYAVVWRMRAAPAFHRGYINYLVVFQPGTKRARDGDALLSGLLRPRLSLNQTSYSGNQQPGPDGLPPAVAAAAAAAAAAEVVAAEDGPVAGAAVRGPPLPQLSWLAALRSRLLGTYTNHWHQVDRTSIRESQARPGTHAHSQAAVGTAAGSTQQQGMAARATSVSSARVAAGSGSSGSRGADAASSSSGDDAWGDVVLGEVTLRRACAPRFVFALLQVARARRSSGVQGGLFVDYVQLKPLHHTG